MAHTLCMLDYKAIYTMRLHTPTRPGTHMHARTRKHAHTYQCVIFIAFPQQQLFRERASVLRYTYIALRVNISHCLHFGVEWTSE